MALETDTDLDALRLGPPLPNGRGGQGTVHTVLGHGDLVAKVYHEDHRPDGPAQQRLQRLIAAGDDPLRACCAWPRALLTIDGRPTLVLPRVAQAHQLHELMDRSSRLRHFGGADWAFVVLTAQRLAEAAATVHAAGLLMVDFSETNALVDAAARVTLIDCDSFRFAGQGTDSCSSTYTLGWTAPELVEQSLAKVPRTFNHDNFALAVALFKLLFQGSEPMQPMHRREESTGPRVFVFSRRRPVRKANVNELTLEALPPRLAELFEQAFDPGSEEPLGSRPTARDWSDELRTLRRQIRHCPKVAGHSHYAGLRKCPWCSMARVHPQADNFRPEVEAPSPAQPAAPGAPKDPPQAATSPAAAASGRRWPWAAAGAVALAVLVWGLQHGNDATTAMGSGDADLRQRAAADVAQTLALINGPQFSADSYAARFAPNAVVHGGDRRSQPRPWAESMLSRWPDRRYRARSGEPHISCSDTARRCEVDMVVDFEVGNASTGKRNNGCWNYVLTLDMSSAPSRIVREDKGPRCGPG